MLATTPPRPAGLDYDAARGAAMPALDASAMAPAPAPPRPAPTTAASRPPAAAKPARPGKPREVMPPSAVSQYRGSRQRTKSFPGFDRGASRRATGQSRKGKAGGGKGSWGRLRDDIDVGLRLARPNDDSVLFEDVSGGTNANGIAIIEYPGAISTNDMRTYLAPKLTQYFLNEDMDELLPAVRVIADAALGPDIVELIVAEATERNSHERELASKLLVQLSVRGVLSLADMGRGFDGLLARLPDLALDTPDAAQVLGKFIARAVADELLAPAFVRRRRRSSSDSPPPTDDAVAAVTKAHALINTPQGLERLVHCWGTNGAHSPVEELRAKVQLCLRECAETGDTEEAELCIRELRAQHFHHEVVFQAVVLAIDSGNERTMLRMSALLGKLCASLVISDVQLRKGVARVWDAIDDISLDAPRAALFLDTFCRLTNAVLPPDFCRKVAKLSIATVNKAKGGRRRTVSERVPPKAN